MRTDPSDNGGLFVGRRPGTAPVKYRSLPEPGTAGRRRFDRGLAFVLLGLMVLACLCFWGPIPLGWLWVGAQVQGATDSISIGILAAFVGMLLSLCAALAVLKRLDHFWILVRRAGGHDQRTGMIGPVFGVTAAVGAVIFAVWFFIIAGPGPMLAPTAP